MTTRTATPANADDDQQGKSIRPGQDTTPKRNTKATRWRKKPSAEALRLAMDAQRPLGFPRTS